MASGDIGSVVFHNGAPYIVVGNNHGAVTTCPLGATVPFYTGTGKDENGREIDLGDYPFQREFLTDENGKPHAVSKAPREKAE